MRVPESAAALIASGPLAHLTTLNPDGSPQVTAVWVELQGDELAVGHMVEHKKVKNVRREPRVAVSIESPTKSEMGVSEYLVLYGSARIEEGGAAELLQRLAHVYMGPDVKFPPMDDPPPGYVMRIRVDRISGVGPWTGRAV